MTFTDTVNKLLLEFEILRPFYRYMYPTEKLTTTQRDILYRRYGKERADYMISQANKRQQEKPLKKFIAPKYTDKNLDSKISFNLIDNKSDADGALAAVMPGSTNVDVFKNNNTNHQFDRIRNELKHNKYTPPEEGQIIDVVKHEGEHTLQTTNNRLKDLLIRYADLKGLSEFIGTPGGVFKPKGSTASERHRKSSYTQNATEPAAFLSELKTWYFYKTGKTLDASASDKDIQDFKNAAVKYIYEKKPKGGRNYLHVLELLDMDEGMELFRQIVQSKTNKFKNYT
jgi:hypothetical protein